MRCCLLLLGKSAPCQALQCLSQDTAQTKHSSTNQQCMEDTATACIARGDESFVHIQNQGGFMLRSLMFQQEETSD